MSKYLVKMSDFSFSLLLNKNLSSTPDKNSNLVLWNSDVSFACLITNPPPKLSLFPPITTSPFSSPTFHEEFEIINALFKISTLWLDFILIIKFSGIIISSLIFVFGFFNNKTFSFS